MIIIEDINKQELANMVRCKDHIAFKKEYPLEYFHKLFNFVTKSADHLYEIQFKHGTITWEKNSVDKSCNSIASRMIQGLEVFRKMEQTDFLFYDIADDVLRFKIQKWFEFVEINYARMGSYYE